MRLGTLAVGLALASVLWFIVLHNFHSSATAPGNPGEHHGTDAAHGGSNAFGRAQQLAGFGSGRLNGGTAATAAKVAAAKSSNDFYAALEAAETSVGGGAAGGENQTPCQSKRRGRIRRLVSTNP